ncbi:MAG: tripartite tricarboxylate transporter TctB family protein, partial [Gammaproteobacteria bacterium]|nr:tripartite tricarboxylate transporter TctB family protein [Gammaproteobacteria bacterium]
CTDPRCADNPSHSIRPHQEVVVMMTLLRSRHADLAIAVLLLLLAALLTWTAYSYTRSSGLFPIFAGWLFIALVILEVVIQLRKLRHSAPDAGIADGRRWRRKDILLDLGGPVWLGFLLLVIYLAGFLVAIPAFLFLFLVLAAERPAAHSAVIALALTGFVYLVFAWLLEYRLFAGVLFGG